MEFRVGIEECDRTLVAESTQWHRLRYGKSLVEVRVGIEECDRSLVADSTLWHWIGYEKSQMDFRVGIEECDRRQEPLIYRYFKRHLEARVEEKSDRFLTVAS
jgi:hypothetical protein